MRSAARVVAAVFEAATVVALISCGPPTEPLPPPPSERAPPEAPEVQAALDALDRLTDPQNWALFHPNEPVAGYHEIYRLTDRPEITAFDEVRAYHFGFDRWNDAGADAVGIDGAGPGSCLGRIIADEGALCPSVVLPGLDVSVEMGRELLVLFDRSDPNVAAMCDEAAHHAFVYYQKGVPVGEVRFGTDCPRWSVSPGPDRTQAPDGVRRALLDLCRRAGLSLCDPSEAPALARAKALWERNNLDDSVEVGGFQMGSRRRPRALSFDVNTAVSALDPQQRLELCVWNTEAVIALRAPADQSSSARGLDFPGIPNTHFGRALPWPECLERFPQCGQAVRDVLPCMDLAQRGDVTFALPVSERCRALRSCVWGFDAWVEESEASRTP